MLPAPAQQPPQQKMFIGGISWQTTDANLRYYFERYGEIEEIAIMKDKFTGQPRGFGFIKFKDDSGMLTHFLPLLDTSFAGAKYPQLDADSCACSRSFPVFTHSHKAGFRSVVRCRQQS
jgi:RNA recognition motif. (a.k.a. RRM, RBD, or RNP domain)